MSKLRVEKAEGIRPGNGPEMFEASVAAAPERGGFRSAAAIENENGRIVKSGISKGADGVGEMVIHEAKLRFRWSEEAPEMIFAAALVGHAEELPRRIEQRAGVHRLPARGVAAQIVQVCQRADEASPGRRNPLRRRECRRNPGKRESRGRGTARRASRG